MVLMVAHDEEAWEVVSYSGSEGSWELADAPLTPLSGSPSSSSPVSDGSLDLVVADGARDGVSGSSRGGQLVTHSAARAQADMAQQMFGHPLAAEEDSMKHRRAPRHLKVMNGKQHQKMPRGKRAKANKRLETHRSAFTSERKC